MPKHPIYTMSFARVYPLYVAKAERKGRTKKEVDQIIRWLTGYNATQLASQLKKETNMETFFEEAPKLNPARTLITGVVCGVRVEDVREPIMREIRYLDKLIDELAKGKKMEKILRTESNDFPSIMGRVAPRELIASGIHNLEQAAQCTEKELLAIHGVGPKDVGIIRKELAKRKLGFKKSR